MLVAYAIFALVTAVMFLIARRITTYQLAPALKSGEFRTAASAGFATTTPNNTDDNDNDNDSKTKPVTAGKLMADLPTPVQRRVRVYTRTGDKGESSLFTMERRPKDDLVFEALGDTDELAAAIGAAHVHCVESKNGLAEKLAQIQATLLDVGSNIATPRSSSDKARLARTVFDAGNVDTLEKWIDELDAKLPPLSSFILPGGGHCSAALHMARSICRRAERHVVPLVRESEVDESVLMFLNRLSDFFFNAARVAAQHDGFPMIIYKKGTMYKAD